VFLAFRGGGPSPPPVSLVVSGGWLPLMRWFSSPILARYRSQRISTDE
jgi:hypothetical protein